jgi:hypothetical protein
VTRRLFVAIAALLLALGFVSATFLALRQPLSLGDYLAVWGLKARAVHASGELSAVFRVDPAGEFSHPEYPPLWPLLLAGTATLLGRYDELLLTLLRPFLLALAAGLTFARTRAPLPWRLLAAASLTLLPYFQTAAYAGYAETLLLVLVLAALLLLESRVPTPVTPVAAGLLLALASLTKQEGTFVLLVAAGLLAVARRRRDAAIVGGLGLGLGVVPWSLYRASHGVSGLADFGPGAFDAGKPFVALQALRDIALLPGLPWLLGAALLLALAPAVRRERGALLGGAAVFVALLPVAALLPALFEAAAEPFGTREE